jgi:uncharacterized membrane protein (UPF0127 family)
MARNKVEIRPIHDNLAGMKAPRIVTPLAGIVIAAGLVFFFGCNKPAAAPPAGGGGVTISLNEPKLPTEAQPKLPTMKLWLGAEQMDAEMCRTPLQTHTGMMFRKTMGDNDGMIFDLDYDQQASFWMKNCYVPLSVAYIAADGTIEEIHPLQPQDTNAVLSASNNIHFALETPQGWFDKHHVTTGMVVRTEKGSLMETFEHR